MATMTRTFVLQKRAKAKMRAVRQAGLHKVVERQAKELNVAIAVIGSGTRLSYQETSATLPVKISFLGVKYGENIRSNSTW